MNYDASQSVESVDMEPAVETVAGQSGPVRPRKSFLHHAAIYWLGRMATRSLSVVLLPIITACLSPAEYGELTILGIIIDAIVLIVSLQLPVAVYRFWAKEDTTPGKHRVLGGAMLLTLVAPTVLFLPVYFWPARVCSLLDLPGRTDLLRLVLFEAQVAMIVTIMLTEMRVRDESGRFAVWEFSQVIGIGLLSVVLVAGFRLGIWGMFLAQTAVFAGIVVCLFPGFLKRVGLSYHRALMKSMLRYALPLVPSAVALAALNFADRFFLQRMVGMEATGLYSIGYRFGTLVGILVIGPFFLIWEPRRFAIAQEPNASKNYGEIFTYLLVLSSFVALGLTGLAREVVHILTAREYWQAYTIVPIIAWSQVFFGLSCVVSVGLFVHHRTATVSWLVLVALVVNTVANLLLIPVYGAHGAAVANFTAYFLLFALNLAFSHRFIAIAFEWQKLAVLTGLALAAGACMALLPETNLLLDIVIKLFVLLCFLVSLFALGFFSRLRLPQRASLFWRSLRGVS